MFLTICTDALKQILFFCKSLKFRPTYGRLHEIRALIPPGVPLLAATSTVTPVVREDVVYLLDMKGCEVVCSPDRPNIYYEV